MTPVVVQCPSCSQKYRVPPATVGHRARCKQCSAIFLIASETPLDEDAIVAWITDGDPSSKSVMGSTGIFDEVAASDAHQPSSASRAKPATSVRLRGIDAAGAHFSFSSAVLAGEDLRNSFPRKCIGCGTRAGLRIHLIHWPERLGVHDSAHAGERMDRSVGDLEGYEHGGDKGLLRQLPHTSHVRDPYSLPFPVFTCPHCGVSREIQAHVETIGGSDVCHLSIASLGVAVEFFRANGGKEAPEYRRLVEARDLQHDPWRELPSEVRHRLTQWVDLRPGEQFIGLFTDLDTLPAQAGASGIALTTHRLLVRRTGVRTEYALSETGRLEMVAKADQVTVHVYETGHPPALVRLDRRAAEDLAAAIRKLKSRWSVTV